MRIIFILLFTFISLNLYASPYASAWLYKKMLDFIQNPSAYKDDFTNGILNDNNSDIIVGAFIEDAYSVYTKEEEFTPEIKTCGNNCYQFDKSSNILQAYHKFFYIFAIAPQVSGMLLQNPIENENITYYIKNKCISYTWRNKNHLIITINNDKLEFKKQKQGVIITTTIIALQSYILN